MSSPARAEGYDTPAKQREDSTTFMVSTTFMIVTPGRTRTRDLGHRDGPGVHPRRFPNAENRPFYRRGSAAATP